MRSGRKFALVTLALFAGAVLSVALAVAVVTLAGVYYNGSGSAPTGYYQLSGAPLSGGGYVLACPPPHARDLLHRYLAWHPWACPGHRQPMLKSLAAFPGDHVAVTADGVAVNGVRLPGSRPLARDSGGRSLPAYRWTGRLRPDHYWLASPQPTSLDSRYFGPVHRDSIIGAADPIWRVSDP